VTTLPTLGAALDEIVEAVGAVRRGDPVDLERLRARLTHAEDEADALARDWAAASALIGLATPDALRPVAELLRRLRQLVDRLEAGEPDAAAAELRAALASMKTGVRR
jgi:hypothetical protein